MLSLAKRQKTKFIIVSLIFKEIKQLDESLVLISSEPVCMVHTLEMCSKREVKDVMVQQPFQKVQNAK